jgi:hypothetical protein
MYTYLKVCPWNVKFLNDIIDFLLLQHISQLNTFSQQDSSPVVIDSDCKI